MCVCILCLFDCLFAELLNEDVDPKKKLDDLIHLAELCIEVLQQNEEYHAEVSHTITPHTSHWTQPSYSNNIMSSASSREVFITECHHHHVLTTVLLLLLLHMFIIC